jgi:hypothetical protein
MMEKSKQSKAEEVNTEALTNVEAALTTLIESEKVDEGAVEKISSLVAGLNEKTQAAIVDTPAFQAMLGKVAEKSTGAAEPGSYRKVGAYNIKVPYTQEDVYTKTGEVERFVPVGNHKVIFGGWTYLVHDGIIYDQPRDLPAEKMPEGHGYRVPGIVPYIIEQQREEYRRIRRETQEKEFGMGVKWLETGWPGKDTAIAQENDDE